MQRFILAGCVWAGAFGLAFSQTLEIIPSRVLMDESAIIRATGLEPNQHILIQAKVTDGAD
jgi:hypothetical protein